jgi:hypothetical protein
MGDRQTFHNGRLRVELDRGEVYPDDPGNGTPALVCVGKNTGTYWCVVSEGELMDGPTLTQSELRWLASIEPAIELFLYGEVTNEDA